MPSVPTRRKVNGYFYEGGQFWKKGGFHEGRKDSTWTTWYESGQKLQEGPYQDGMEQGEWHSWFKDDVR